MDAKINGKILESYFLGTCSEHENVLVEEWLASKEQGDEDLALMNVIFDGIDVRDDIVADSAFEKCVETLNISHPLKNSTPVRNKRWRSVLYVAALALVFIVLSVFWKYRLSAGVDLQEVYVQRGESQTVQLPDGSSMILKSGTKLIYPAEFKGGTRKVFLSGECYASIASDHEHPFILSTGTVRVLVTGTEFNIKSFPEDSETEVALVEGSVILDGESGSALLARSVTLSPGKVIKLDCNSGETRINEFNADHYVDVGKKEDAFIFINQRFSDIVRELSRRKNVDIILLDKSLGERRFYSSFINGESVMEILESFNADESMEITVNEDIINITGR